MTPGIRHVRHLEERVPGGVAVGWRVVSPRRRPRPGNGQRYPATSTRTLAAADVNTQMEPVGDNFAITSLATVPPPSSSHSTCQEPSHTGTPWRTPARQHPPTSRWQPPPSHRPAHHHDPQPGPAALTSSHRSRPGVSQPHRRQRHEVRRRRHIPGNIDQHVGRRRREHTDRTRRRQLDDQLIGDRCSPAK